MTAHAPGAASAPGARPDANRQGGSVSSLFVVRGTRMDANGTAWRLRSLIAMGHDASRIARALGAGPHLVQRLIRGDSQTVTIAFHLRACQLWDAWWDKNPTPATAPTATTAQPPAPAPPPTSAPRTGQRPAGVPVPGVVAGDPAGQQEGGQVFWTELPGNLRAPCRARAAIRNVLASWGLSSLTPDTELLASELVANAAEHTPGRPIGLLIRQTTTQAGQPGIRCEVADSSPELPPADPSRPGSERGRGLAIVTAVAADSGITARRDGKTAWFTLTTPGDPARAARTAEPEAEAGA